MLSSGTGPLHWEREAPWIYPGKNTGVGNYSLLQDIFLTQGSNCTAGRLFRRGILWRWRGPSGLRWVWRNAQVALMVKNPPASLRDAGYAGSIPGSVRSPGGGNDNPLQYSCLDNSMDRELWLATVAIPGELVHPSNESSRGSAVRRFGTPV